MNAIIYVDFENRIVYTEENLQDEAERLAKEYDELRGDEFEDFLRREEGYSIYDIFAFDSEAQEKILEDYHRFNVDVAIDTIMRDVEEFEIKL